MSLVDTLEGPVQTINNLLSKLGSPLLLFFRLYVAWVFLKSGLFKIGDWETTLVLFEYEYAVPVLPFEVAAYLATFAELVFPVFLIAGLGTRFFCDRTIDSQRPGRGFLLRHASKGRRSGLALYVGLDAAHQCDLWWRILFYRSVD